MKYNAINDLPSSVKASLPIKAQKIWMNAYNATRQKHNDNITSIKTAWTIIKANYIKTNEGWTVKAKCFDIKYTTPITSAEIITIGNKKKAIVTMTVLNNKMNLNGWRVLEKYHSTLAAEVNGKPIKLQHSYDDWDIIGSGIGGEVKENEIFAKTEITDPKAVEKFETNTWNANNMGVSPGIRIKDMICSICGDSVMYEVHKHKPNEKYNGEVCVYDVIDPHLKEVSLTSDPAYAGTGAGTIDNITITASLNKLLEASIIDEVDSMEDENKTIAESAEEKKKLEADKLKTDAEAKVKADAEKIETELKAAKEKELEASRKTAGDSKELLEASRKELEATNARLKVILTANRTAELEKVGVTDTELVASIVDKDMSDAEFTAEIKKIEMIRASVQPNTGSLPSDKSNKNAQSDDDVCIAEFGVDQATLLAKVIGRTNHQLAIKE